MYSIEIESTFSIGIEVFTRETKYPDKPVATKSLKNRTSPETKKKPIAVELLL